MMGPVGEKACPSENRLVLVSYNSTQMRFHVTIAYATHLQFLLSESKV